MFQEVVRGSEYTFLFFFKSCLLWNIVEKYGRPRQATNNDMIRRKRIACWITTATDTPSEYVIFIAFPHSMWLRKLASMLRCTYIAWLVSSKCTSAFKFVAWTEPYSVWIPYWHWGHCMDVESFQFFSPPVLDQASTQVVSWHCNKSSWRWPCKGLTKVRGKINVC